MWGRKFGICWTTSLLFSSWCSSLKFFCFCFPFMEFHSCRGRSCLFQEKLSCFLLLTLNVDFKEPADQTCAAGETHKIPFCQISEEFPVLSTQLFLTPTKLPRWTFSGEKPQHSSQNKWPHFFLSCVLGFEIPLLSNFSTKGEEVNTSRYEEKNKDFGWWPDVGWGDRTRWLKERQPNLKLKKKLDPPD